MCGGLVAICILESAQSPWIGDLGSEQILTFGWKFWGLAYLVAGWQSRSNIHSVNVNAEESMIKNYDVKLQLLKIEIEKKRGVDGQTLWLLKIVNTSRIHLVCYHILCWTVSCCQHSSSDVMKDPFHCCYHNLGEWRRTCPLPSDF